MHLLVQIINNKLHGVYIKIKNKHKKQKNNPTKCTQVIF